MQSNGDHAATAALAVSKDSIVPIKKAGQNPTFYISLNGHCQYIRGQWPEANS